MKKDNNPNINIAFEEIIQKEADSFANKIDIQEVENNEDFLISHFNNLIRKKFNNLNDYKSKSDLINKMITAVEESNFSEQMLSSEPRFIKSISNNSFYTNKDFFVDFKKEFLTCNEINIIAPFFSRHMINTHLRPFIENLNGTENVKIKILTTTFDGKGSFLDLKGLLKLVKDFPEADIQIKIENLFEKNSTRIHIKSYIFKRDNGFGSAYIGSSNYTKTGIISGNEWNHKTSEFENKQVFDEIVYNFNLLWQNSNLVDINDENAINEILERQLINDSNEKLSNLILARENFKPKKYQSEALNKLRNRRKENLRKHLIVMATGTGKTVVSALDYLNQISENNNIKPKLIFIADKVEIIRQAMKTYRSVLKDDSFGVEYSGDIESELEKENYVFATIQKLSNNKEILQKKDFDVVVFDEAHHVKANGFTEIYKILDKGNQIIGLTATPEREDGVNVKDLYFDGEYAYELRLWDAVSENMLSNFDYYFIKDDSVDISGLALKNVDQISEKLSTTVRSEFVYKNLNKFINLNDDENSVLVFCIDQKHAISTSDYLKSRGLSSEFLISGQNDQRSKIVKKFKNKEIQYLCVVNIFNEGVDVPDVNHLVFLRPTQSLTLYIQQFGRGLRWQQDKKLQVLDFVNNVDAKYNKNYSPINIVNAFLSNTNRLTIEQSTDDLSNLVPADSNIFLDKKLQKEVIESIKKAVQNKKTIFKNLDNVLITGNYKEYEKFFLDTGFSPSEVYYKNQKDGLKSFIFEENRNHYSSTAVMQQFIWLNNYDLISEFLKIIKSKKLSGIQQVDNIFVHSFLYNHSTLEKIKTDFGTTDFNQIIFKESNQFLLKEIYFLLKYKIKNENLISNDKMSGEINLVGTYFTKRQSLAVSQISKLDLLSIQLIQGIFKNKEKNKFIIWASDPTGKEKFDFENFYNVENNKMGWPSPDDWNENNKTYREFVNCEETYIFYKDLELINKYNDQVFEFKGWIKDKVLKPNSNKGMYFEINVSKNKPD